MATWRTAGHVIYVPLWVAAALRAALLPPVAEFYALRLVANYLADEARAAQAAGVDLPDGLIQAQQVVAAALGQEALP